jgi:hypothetical protein
MNKDILSDYQLESYVLGELPLELDKKIRWMAAVDPAVRGAVAAIESSNREILSLYPPPGVAEKIMARWNEKGWRTGWAGRPWRSRLVPVSTAAAALLLLLAFLVPGLKDKVQGVFGGAGGGTSRVKGIETLDTTRTQLLVFRQKKDQVEILGDENRARAGDLLQLAYVAAGDPFGVILSVDGRGGVTLHFPLERGGSTALVQNRKFLLPNSIELDDAPSFERFFLITAKSPIDVAAVLAKAEALAANLGEAARSDLDLPRGLHQSSVLILKGEGS